MFNNILNKIIYKQYIFNNDNASIYKHNIQVKLNRELAGICLLNMLAMLWLVFIISL